MSTEYDVPRPQLRFALMADYVMQANDGKLSIIGIYDNFAIGVLDAQSPVLVPGFFVTQVEASLAFGAQHNLVVSLLDEDEHAIFNSPEQPVTFTPAGEGAGLRLVFVLKMGPIKFADAGHFQWCVYIDGERVGSCTFSMRVIATQ